MVIWYKYESMTEESTGKCKLEKENVENVF